MCKDAKTAIPTTVDEPRAACQGSCDAHAKSACSSAAPATQASISLDGLRAQIKADASPKD